MSTEATHDRCTIRLPPTGKPCNRLLIDPCEFCAAFEVHKAEWCAIFDEYRSPPRVAVEGDT